MKQVANFWGSTLSGKCGAVVGEYVVRNNKDAFAKRVTEHIVVKSPEHSKGIVETKGLN